MVKSKTKRNIDEVVTGWMGSMRSIYVHTFLFIFFLTLPFFINISYDYVLLVLTTIVSLEAIYLALFIQISINRQALAIDEVSEDIEEIQEDVEEINESVDEIEKDVDELSDDVEELSVDVEEVSKDIEEISEDVVELSDDVEEIQQDMDKGDEVVHLLRAEREAIKSDEEKEIQRKEDQKIRLEKLENMLANILKEISNLKK